MDVDPSSEGPGNGEQPQIGTGAGIVAGVGIRRTLLAEERTYLAWFRSALAAFGVSLAAGKIVPALTHATQWPYSALSAGFATLGIACVVYGFARQTIVTRAIEQGRFVALDRWFLTGIAFATAILGIATAIVAAG